MVRSPFALSLPLCLPIPPLSPKPVTYASHMPTIERSALVEHSVNRMFALVNDIAAYPRRFEWWSPAAVLEAGEARALARVELGIGGFRTRFTTANTLSPPHHIDMDLHDGPFRRLRGRWQFHALDETACKVSLSLE